MSKEKINIEETYPFNTSFKDAFNIIANLISTDKMDPGLFGRYAVAYASLLYIVNQKEQEIIECHQKK